MGEIDRQDIFWGGSTQAYLWKDNVTVTGYAEYRIDGKSYPLRIFINMSKQDYDDIDKRKELLWQDAIAQKEVILERISEGHYGRNR